MLEAKKMRINLATFDLIKGVVVILIVLGHKLFYYNLDADVLLGPLAYVLMPFKYGINPVFFLISGFNFKRQPDKKLLKKSFSDLIKPYLYVMLGYAVCFPTFHYAAFRWWPGAIQETIRYLLAFALGLPEGGKTFLGYELYECSIVWFFLSMFIALNLLNQVIKIKSEVTQCIVAFLSLLAGYWLSLAEFTYYCIPQGLMGLGYCYLGYLIKSHSIHKSRHLLWICIGLAAVSAVQAIFGDFAMGYGIYKYGFVECIMAGCSGVLMLFLGIICGNSEWKYLAPIKTVGVYAYWIFCIHAVDMSCIPWYQWSAIMAEHQLLGYWLEVVMTAAIITVGCLVLKRIAKYKYTNRKLRKNEQR